MRRLSNPTDRQEPPSQALAAYGRGGLSEDQVHRLLGLDSRFDVHALLKARGLYIHYGLDDLEEDLRFANPGPPTHDEPRGTQPSD